MFETKKENTLRGNSTISQRNQNLIVTPSEGVPAEESVGETLPLEQTDEKVPGEVVVVSEQPRKDPPEAPKKDSPLLNKYQKKVNLAHSLDSHKLADALGYIDLR